MQREDEPKSGVSSASDSRSRIGLDGSYLSAKAFGIAVALLLAGGFLGGLLPIVGNTLGRAAGLFVGAFVVALLLSERRYVETGLAGAGVGLASALTGVVTAGVYGVHFLQEYGLGLAVVGSAVGLVLALVGHYFGRDLRSGLTQDVE